MADFRIAGPKLAAAGAARFTTPEGLRQYQETLRVIDERTAELVKQREVLSREIYRTPDMQRTVNAQLAVINVQLNALAAEKTRIEDLLMRA